jgi:3-oxoacyl-[acyl-carrier-protein] synthase II
MVSPLGASAAATFDAAEQGRSGIREITRFDPTGLPCRIAGEVDDAGLSGAAPAHPFDRLGGRPLRLIRAAASQAAAAADLASVADRSRVAVVVGGHANTPEPHELRAYAGLTDAEGRVDLARAAAEAPWEDEAFPRRLCDVVPALLARLLDARGPSIPIVSACAAGAQAIGEGARLLREGRADAVLAGGTEAQVTYAGFVGFVLLGALAKKAPSPQAASRPFDRRRSGFVMSEGAGAVVLETLAGARERGRRVYGEVLGYGDSADAYRITEMPPDGAGAALAMTRAMADAGVGPDDVEYVNAHGTSTALNDPAETAAVKRALGDRARAVPISSNKSMIGHTIGAAGAIEAILTWIGIERGVLLPTINLETPDPRCDLDYVPNVARRVPHRVALSNSFGFGGQNACLCLGAAPE